MFANNLAFDPFVFDDFELTQPTRITSIYVNQIVTSLPASADFRLQIRQGPMVGTGGTVLFTHFGTTDSIVPTGRTLMSLLEATYRENDIDLLLQPGINWIHVSAGFNSTSSGTTGLNGLGNPINNRSIVFDTFARQFWQPVQFDVSFGIDGTVVPEPGT